MPPLPTPPLPTDMLVTDLRFHLVTEHPEALRRAHLGEHVADHLAAALLLTDPAAAALAGHALVHAGSVLARIAVQDAGERLAVCPHAATVSDVAAYAGLALIDRAQAATR